MASDNPTPSPEQSSGEALNEPTPLYSRLRQALLEDIGPLTGLGDVTSNALVSTEKKAKGKLIAKQDGIVCGIHLWPLIFQMAEEFLSLSVQNWADDLHKAHQSAKSGEGDWDHVEALALKPQPKTTHIEIFKKDGERVNKGEVIANYEGSARAILFGERTALNLTARLCGIATLTSRYVEQVKDTRAHIFDTRKTTPLWRDLEKYAVKSGGGMNHRTGLYDMILIKDNHLALWGAIDPAGAVRAAQARFPKIPVEVEVLDLEGLKDVCKNSSPTYILIDNFSPEQMRTAVEWSQAHFGMKKDRPQLEASGGINLKTVRSYALTGVDRISVGALTHSSPSLDLSMRFEE